MLKDYLKKIFEIAHRGDGLRKDYLRSKRN